ncbi:MAG: DUF169 domain-containing protein [Clostridia bacterium]|nr:DUF169 domain-containing protein [Clostridia bacterium]
MTDLSVFSRLGFLRPPVGVKFLFFRPEGIDPLAPDKELSLCEMLVEAQNASRPFYFCREHAETCVGKILLGMEDMEAFAESGQIGERLKIFQEARANSRLYQYVPRLGKNTVNYVAFAPLEKLTFEPDVLILNASVRQAEVVLRSMSYSTGEIYTSKSTPVMGCAWTYLYPYQSGRINYVLPDTVHGMRARELFPEGSMLLSIPYQWLGTIVRNLNEMNIELPSYQGKERYLVEFGNILRDLVEQARNP